MARLKDKYQSEIRPKLKEDLGLSSIMQVPEITKITLNMGVGDAKTNSKLLDAAVEQLALISGQRPIITKAKNSVAGFKLREEMPIGCKVTLRGERMYEFLDRFLAIALPRIRDFRGIKSTAFDGQGNYAVGISEQIIFPEVDYDQVDVIRGLDVVFTIKGGSKEGSKALLDEFGFPFVKPATATAQQ
ncbi:MAG: ribosomal protein [Thermoleophilia bacterium]|nr:ribosomal protein [Thermoleophilia bacterium]